MANKPATIKKIGRRAITDNTSRIRMGAVISKYRKDKNMSVAALAELMGCSSVGVGNWERGTAAPGIDLIPQLCEVLDIPIHELMGTKPYIGVDISESDEQLLKSYHSLTPKGQSYVDLVIDTLLEEQQRSNLHTIRTFTKSMDFVDEVPTAAGPGVPAPDRAMPEKMYVHASRSAKKSNLIMRVNGNSMEPTYPDGCLVYVNTKEETPLGEVGIFIVDGEYFIKERHTDCLYSLNREHTDIMFNNNMDIRHYGIVVGIVSDDDILTGEELKLAQEAYTEGDQ